MFYIVLAKDKPGSNQVRIDNRQEHIDYWLGQEDSVKVAGAMLESDAAGALPIGSSFLLEADNIETVRSLIANDPFMLKGVFGNDIRIEVIRPALGSWKPD